MGTPPDENGFGPCPCPERSSPHEFTIAQSAKLVFELSGLESRIERRDLSEDDRENLPAGHYAIPDGLGWEQRFDFGSGCILTEA